MSSCHVSNKKNVFLSKNKTFVPILQQLWEKRRLTSFIPFPFFGRHLMCVFLLFNFNVDDVVDLFFFFSFFTLLEDNRSTLFVSSNLPSHHTVYIYDTGSCCCCSVNDIDGQRMQIISWGVVVVVDEENPIISLRLKETTMCFCLHVFFPK